MTYLPPRPTDPTFFPQPDGKDIDTDIKLIEEMWLVHYPNVGYRPIDKRVTPNADPTTFVVDPDTLVGEAGGTKVDVLYMESIDPSRTTWRQPHGTNGTVKAADVEVYKPEVRFNMMVEPVTQEGPDLKKYGFDNDDRRMGTLLCVTPVSILDRLGITVQEGDLVLYERDQWVVIKASLSGYWENTNVRLYMNMLCERRRHGG